MKEEMYVVVGMSIYPEDGDLFLCEVAVNHQLGSLREVQYMKETCEKLYSHSYVYRIAKLTFLD